ncbi:hypothetical protein TNCV_679951 [Trichonephila clavipes]|nr:hypothetical protein TNCV_679951 [Trichonephila clavipes]
MYKAYMSVCRLVLGGLGGKAIARLASPNLRVLPSLPRVDESFLDRYHSHAWDYVACKIPLVSESEALVISSKSKIHGNDSASNENLNTFGSFREQLLRWCLK